VQDGAVNEHELMGGNTTRVIRIGDTVRRAAGPWTPTVQAYLRHLRSVGMTGVPEPFGVDDRGREIVSFIEGDVANESQAWLWSDEVLTSAAMLLRRLHDASAEYLPDRATWRLPTHEPAEVVCHNDFAPYNLVFDGGRVVGVIDFDTASPGPRIWDLAYLGYRLAPYIDEATWTGTDRDRARRLATLIDAYGADWTTAEVLEVMADRLDELAELTDGRAAETGRDDLARHAVMYRADASRLRGLAG
jgi:aminoglycoside phosphotransferase